MSRRPRLALLTLAWVACTSDPAGVATATDTDDTTGTPTPDRCAEASASRGQHLCEQDVPDLAAWSKLSLPVDLVDQARTGKYLVPARADARVDPGLQLVFGAQGQQGVQRSADQLAFGEGTELAHACQQAQSLGGVQRARAAAWLQAVCVRPAPAQRAHHLEPAGPRGLAPTAQQTNTTVAAIRSMSWGRDSR